MIVVLDASAGFELLLETKNGKAVRTILENSGQVIAPDIFPAELSNVCYKAVNHGRFNLNSAIHGLKFSLGLVDTFVPCSGLAVEALTQAVLVDHPVYDLLYLTLAMREGAYLLTLDKKLHSLAKRNGILLCDLR